MGPYWIVDQSVCQEFVYNAPKISHLWICFIYFFPSDATLIPCTWWHVLRAISDLFFNVLQPNPCIDPNIWRNQASCGLQGTLITNIFKGDFRILTLPPHGLKRDKTVSSSALVKKSWSPELNNFAELFNNRDFGLPSRQHQKEWGCFITVSFFFPKELDFLSTPRPDCLPRNAQHFCHS